jgi:hypothetical protein
MQEGIAQDSFSVLKKGSIRNGTVAFCETTGYELTTGIIKEKEMMMETSMVRKTSIKRTVLPLHELQRWPNLWELLTFKHVKNYKISPEETSMLNTLLLLHSYQSS